jgi:large subunit ribosomal protein L11
MAKKEIIDTFKIMAPGGQATPAPPLGPVLGAKGVNPGQFIQKFNAATAALKGKIVGCVVTVFNDKSFNLEIKSSPASVLIREAAGIEKGSGVPNKEKVGKINKAQCEKIAKEKMADLNASSVEAACRIIAGQARSMGVTVEGL